MEDPNFDLREIDRDQVEKWVRLAKGRIFGEETRGGAREEGPPGKARTCFPNDWLSGRQFFYNFNQREKGRGSAKKDQEAIRTWLSAKLVEEYGRRWIEKTSASPKASPKPGPYTVAEYQHAFKRGPKTRARKRAATEAIVRARELVRDGANIKSIAAVVGLNEQTLGRRIKGG